MHFTSRMLNELEPADKRFEVRERGGLTIRVTPSGRKVWSLVWRCRGKLTRATLGEFPAMSLMDARQESKQLRARSAAVTSQAGSREASWNDLAAGWIDANKDMDSDVWRAERAMLEKRVLPLWGHRPASSIRRSEISRFVADVAVNTPVTASRLLKLITRLYSFGVEQHLIEGNPAARLATPARDHPRRRTLEPEEICRFWQDIGKIPCQAGTRLALKLLLITGMRVGTICALRWDQIEFQRQCWKPLRDGQEVSLSPLAIKLLGAARLLSLGSEWVFPGTSPTKCLTTNALGNALRRNRSRLPLAPFSPDDLRRTAAEALLHPEKWADTLLETIRQSTKPV